MERLRLTEETIPVCAARAAEALRAGGVVLYPTDTLYGLGVDALSDDAVAKIYTLKGRREDRPVHAIVSDLSMAETYAEVTESARLLSERLPEGQVTFILKKQVGFDAGITKGIETFGFRIPANEFCIQMVRAFRRPITATSANRSGERPERSVDKILAQLGEAAEGIDLVIDAGELPERQPSTVVDLSGPTPRIVREGAIPQSAIFKALKSR